MELHGADQRTVSAVIDFGAVRRAASGRNFIRKRRDDAYKGADTPSQGTISGSAFFRRNAGLFFVAGLIWGAFFLTLFAIAYGHREVIFDAFGQKGSLFLLLFPVALTGPTVSLWALLTRAERHILSVKGERYNGVVVGYAHDGGILSRILKADESGLIVAARMRTGKKDYVLVNTSSLSARADYPEGSMVSFCGMDDVFFA